MEGRFVEELQASAEGDASLLGDERVRAILGEPGVKDGPDLPARLGARGGKSFGKLTNNGEVHVDPLEGVAGCSELLLRCRRVASSEGMDEFDVGHNEGGERLRLLIGGHDDDDVSHRRCEVEQILRSNLSRDGLEESVKLRKVRNEVVTAVLAEVLHRLGCSGRNVGFATLSVLLESRGDVGKLELDMLGVIVDPLGVATDDEDGSVADFGVRWELGKDVHDLRHDLVVARIDFGAHGTHGEEGCLDVLPFDGSAGGESRRDDVEGAAEAGRSAEDATAVLERIADGVPEVAEGIAFVADERGVVVRVVEVSNDGADEVGEDVEHGGRGRCRLACFP